MGGERGSGVRLALRGERFVLSDGGTAECLERSKEMNEKIKSYKDLKVWQEAIQLVKDIYQITLRFPKEEIYGLTNQIRRAAVSIPSNIAEGKSRYSKREFLQFLYIAKGSCAEVETQLIIASELKYIDVKTLNSVLEKCDHISRMIMSLIKGLKNDVIR